MANFIAQDSSIVRNDIDQSHEGSLVNACKLVTLDDNDT